jgi:glycine/D-amino acid oxidase-like deaminating enzyme
LPLATAHHVLELLPCLKHVRVLRQWAGICDMTPDNSPIMGEIPEVKGFHVDVGWGTYGFKAGLVAGRRMAELIATGKTPSPSRVSTRTGWSARRSPPPCRVEPEGAI